MVSTVKGYGSRILAELEKALILISMKFRFDLSMLFPSRKVFGSMRRMVTLNVIRHRDFEELDTSNVSSPLTDSVSKVKKYHLDSGYAEESIIFFLCSGRHSTETIVEILLGEP